MSRVEAYRCDMCGEIKESEAIVGILPMRDMFDSLKDFPTTLSPERTTVHHCTECTTVHVINKAEELSPRRRNEREYQLRFNELYSIFKGRCVENAMAKKKVYKRLHM